MDSHTAHQNDMDTIKLFGIGFVAVVILIVMLVAWLNPNLAKPAKPAGPMCDYCLVSRTDAKPFPCRQCGKTHVSCGKESALKAIDARKDKEGFAVGRSIKVCPDVAVKE